MSSVDANKMENLTQSFKAFIQFEDPDNPGDFFRMKSIQNVTVNYDYTDEDRYDDSGILTLVRTGQGHNAAINLILTSGEIDTVDPPTNKNTVSYWLYQKNIGNRVQIFVRETFISEPQSSPETLRNEFTMDLQSVGTTRNVGGAIELPVSGRILDLPRSTFIKS